MESAPGALKLIYHPGPNYFYFLQVEILPSEGAYRDVRDVIGNNFRPTLDDLKSGRRVGHRSLSFKVLGSTLALASLRGACIIKLAYRVIGKLAYKTMKILNTIITFIN